MRRYLSLAALALTFAPATTLSGRQPAQPFLRLHRGIPDLNGLPD